MIGKRRRVKRRLEKQRPPVKRIVRRIDLRQRFKADPRFLSRAAPDAAERARVLLERVGEMHLISKEQSSIIGRGEREVILDLGEFKKGRRSLRLAAKALTKITEKKAGIINPEWAAFELPEKPSPFKETHHSIIPTDIVPKLSEFISHYFRWLGFPVPAIRAVAVPSGKGYCWM